MRSGDLEVFNEMPFFFWVKDEASRYLWGNRVICRFAMENVVGKTDLELVWADNAEALCAHDRENLECGQTSTSHEVVESSGRGKVTLNVCKFVADFEGTQRVFGVSFVIDS